MRSSGEREDRVRRISLISGKELRVKGEQALPRGDRLRLELPGGRLWDPLNREPERVSEDVKEGLGSPTSALTKYGATFDDDGTKDLKETKVMRKKAKNSLRK